MMRKAHSLKPYYNSKIKKAQHFLLGSREEAGLAVVLTEIQTRDSGGCQDMASLSTTALSKARIRLAKRKFIPAGMAIISLDSPNRWMWGGGRGEGIFEIALPFITYHTYGINGPIAQRGNQNRTILLLNYKVSNRETASV